jgi:hypothetical protein
MSVYRKGIQIIFNYKIMKKTFEFILGQIICFLISLLITSFFISLWCFVSWENKFIDTNWLEILRSITVFIYLILFIFPILYTIEN